MAKINYQELLDNALKSVVKEALIYAQVNGLGDGTHFFRLCYSMRITTLMYRTGNSGFS